MQGASEFSINKLFRQQSQIMFRIIQNRRFRATATVPNMNTQSRNYLSRFQSVIINKYNTGPVALGFRIPTQCTPAAAFGLVSTTLRWRPLGQNYSQLGLQGRVQPANCYGRYLRPSVYTNLVYTFLLF